MQINLLDTVISMKKSDYSFYKNKAYTSIYENLFLKNKWGSDKLSCVDEYDSETKTLKQVLPGSIYMFKYKAEQSNVYNINGTKFEYYDNLPIILCMKDNGKTIQGINLNLCNFALRTLLLNDIYKLDPDYFNKTAEIQSAIRHNFPISKNITMFFSNDNILSKFYDRLKTTYKLSNSYFIIRNYKKSNITNIRFIEPWQWKYVPFLEYNNIKDNILKTIQNVTNIDKINI